MHAIIGTRFFPAFLFVLCTRVLLAEQDGQFPPPAPPKLQWTDLLAGKLEDHWSDMNTAIHSPTYNLKPDADGPGQVLALTRFPTGLLRSMKFYENFILECDWRHLTEAPSAGGAKDTSANSGLYIWADPLPTIGGTFTRAIEVQVCNLGNGNWYTSHGDIFPIWGAKMTPDPRFGKNGDRSMPLEFRGKKTGEWNRVRITCVDGTIQQEVNGALVTGGYRTSPRKGYLCIESEGGPVEFRNMRIHELPPDPELKAKDIAMLWPEGTRAKCLYNGVNLDGWIVPDAQKNMWKAAHHELACKGEAAADGVEIILPILPSAEPDFTLNLDWSNDSVLPFALEGAGAFAAPMPATADVKKGWNRATFICHARTIALTINNQKFWETTLEPAAKFELRLRLKNPGHAINFSNLILIEPPAENTVKKSKEKDSK